MIDFFPLKYYQGFYYYIIFFVVLITIINLYNNNFFDKINLKSLNFIGFFLVFFLIIIIGFRPVSGYYFGDTETYAAFFVNFKNNPFFSIEGDPLFYQLMKYSSILLDINFFFFICSILYVLPLYFATNKLFKEYSFYAFLMLIISLSFWSYGVNGVRNGIATSIFLFGITRSKVKFQILFFLIALGFHKSMILPVLGYLLTFKYNSPRVYFIFWIFCIPFSLLIGNEFQNIISSFFEDEKLNNYFYSTTQLSQFSNTGFRWDFLIYSSSGIFSGWYFIVKRGFIDAFFNKIVSIYLFSNGVWIIVIKSSFSNRFAYLSWFLLGLIIVYPFLKKEFFRNQNIILANIIFMYFMITFFLDFLLLKK